MGRPLGEAPLLASEELLSLSFFTFHDHRNNRVGDAKWIARHAAVRTVVLWLNICDCDDRAITADFDVICSEIQQGHF